MVSREEVIAEIQKVPDKHLDELYRIIKNYEETSSNEAAEQNVMALLRQIKISAAPDFSIKSH